MPIQLLNFIEKYFKLLLIFILLLILICFFKISTMTNENIISVPPSQVSIDNTVPVINISDNIIGVIDPGTSSGLNQILVFKYDEGSKNFIYQSSLNIDEYINHPEKYGIPPKKQD